MIHRTGSPTSDLGEVELRPLIEGTLGDAPLKGKRVLAIIPDHSRSGPTDLFFRLICDALHGTAAKLDFLIALGTHQPESDAAIAKLTGMTTEQRAAAYPGVNVFNHDYADPNGLRRVGTLTVDRVGELSSGRVRMEVPVEINARVFDYDHLVICGPVFPHEVVGFSGGHKYLFPGIGAKQIIDFTHWLGALSTNPVINGAAFNPVRACIEAAADLVPVERSLLAYVVEGRTVRGCFGGEVREAWAAATKLSAQLHIIVREEPYHTVLSCSPPMYDDIWTAGKCMYKLEPVVADGGTLIIYAPHITEVSYTHGRVLDEIGYHVRDFFVRQWDRYSGFPWGVVAHSTHVKGVGRCDNDREEPRVNVVLATGIPEERCRRINLGYMDPASVRVEEYAGHESEGVLCVPKAGETLFRLKDMKRFG